MRASSRTIIAAIRTNSSRSLISKITQQKGFAGFIRRMDRLNHANRHEELGKKKRKSEYAHDLGFRAEAASCAVELTHLKSVSFLRLLSHRVSCTEASSNVPKARPQKSHSHQAEAELDTLECLSSPASP